MAKKIRVWDGSAWQDVAPSLPYTAVHSAQASMPATGVDGQVWLDTDGTLADTAFVPLTGGTMTGNLNTPSINAGGIAGQNYLLNGAMDFWQRGTSSTTMNTYLADRWMAMNNNTYYRSTDVPLNQGFQYSSGWGYTAGSTFPLIAYRMSAEEAIFFAGKVVTFSFWAKNVSGTAALYAEYLTPNSTNSFGTVTNQGLIGFYGSPTSTWTRYSATFTATTDLVRGLEFRVVRGNQSPSETLTTGFKLELGNQMTAFTRANPDLGTELAACQRYYETSYNDGFFPANGSSGGGSFQSVATALATGSIRANGFYKVRKRVTPSVVLYRTSGGAINNSWTYYNGADIDATSTSVSADQKGFYVTLNKSASFTLNNSYLVYGDWSADAEL